MQNVMGLSASTYSLLFAVFQGSMGFVFSNPTALALAETQRHAGTGSAFLGFLQFVPAAVVSPLVGVLGERAATPMAITMLVAILLAAVSYAVLPRRTAQARQDGRKRLPAAARG